MNASFLSLVLGSVFWHSPVLLLTAIGAQLAALSQQRLILMFVSCERFVVEQNPLYTSHYFLFLQCQALHHVGRVQGAWCHGWAQWVHRLCPHSRVRSLEFTMKLSVFPQSSAEEVNRSTKFNKILAARFKSHMVGHTMICQLWW